METLVHVTAQKGKEWPRLNGYVEIDPRYNLQHALTRKLEIVLQIPSEEWSSATFKEGKPASFEITLGNQGDDPRMIFNYSMVNKLGPFGNGFNGQWNYCFPKYDRYPSPLLSNSFASKVKGADRWRYAIWFLQPVRLREILLEEVNAWETDQKRLCDLCSILPKLNIPIVLSHCIAEYAIGCTLFDLLPSHNTGILATLCECNHPTNLCESYNPTEYFRCFDVFCHVMIQTPKLAKAIAMQTQQNVTAWGLSEVNFIQNELDENERNGWLRLLQTAGINLQPNSTKTSQEEVGEKRSSGDEDTRKHNKKSKNC
jgi:hypothetical protein